jgi:low affinity Fe/Cu permease
MDTAKQNHPGHRPTKLVSVATAWLGSFPAIVLSVVLVLMWLVCVPLVKGGFLNTRYQLLINTTTTSLTFIMVFIIQSTQNRDARAVQTKLDAILIAIEGDHDHLLGLEEHPEKVIKQVQQDVHDSTDEADRLDGA